MSHEDNNHNGKHSKENASEDRNKKIVNNNSNVSYKKKTKKVKKHKVAKRVFLTILIILLIAVGIFIYNVQKNGGGMAGIVSTVIGSSAEKEQSLEDIYVLAMGKSQNMTDAIMVIKYSPKNQQASMFSIPRDTFVGTDKDKATAWDKINSKYQLGAQNTIDEVNKLTGLNIKYYLTVDTKALRDLVDAIGGVDFDVPINMDYDDCTQDLEIHLTAGMQHLNGQQAEGLVRFRHNNNGTSYSTEYGDNDLGRMKTQREFIKVVLKQLMKAENITKINQLMQIAQEEVATNIEWDVAKDYIPALLKFNTDNLKTSALPGVAQYCNKVAVFLANTDKAKDIVKDLFLTQQDNTQTSDDDTTDNTTATNTTTKKDLNEVRKQLASGGTSSTQSIDASELKIEVLNASGASTKLTSALKQLENQGYKVTKKGTTTPVDKTVIIDRTNNSIATEYAIKSLIGVGTTKSGENNSDVDFTIILGKDY